MTANAFAHPHPLAAWRPSGVHFADRAEVRRLCADFFKTHNGLRSSGLTEAAYEELILPHDTPKFRRIYADHAWSCALRVLAAWRLLGVGHPLLAVPYETRIGRAMSDVETVARAFGALVIGPAVAGYEPEEGDAMISGVGDALHASCVVAVVDGFELHCVDGGQGVKYAMEIAPNIYELERGASSAIVRSIEPPTWSPAKPGPPKPIRSFVDLWQIILGSGLLADKS
jgi:hypothetical protein